MTRASSIGGSNLRLRKQTTDGLRERCGSPMSVRSLRWCQFWVAGVLFSLLAEGRQTVRAVTPSRDGLRRSLVQDRWCSTTRPRSPGPCVRCSTASRRATARGTSRRRLPVSSSRARFSSSGENPTYWSSPTRTSSRSSSSLTSLRGTRCSRGTGSCSRARRARVARLRSTRATGIEYSSGADGLQFGLPAERLGDVARFVENERLCCRHLAFALEVPPRGEALTLRVKGPGAREELRALLR